MKGVVGAVVVLVMQSCMMSGEQLEICHFSVRKSGKLCEKEFCGECSLNMQLWNCAGYRLTGAVVKGLAHCTCNLSFLSLCHRSHVYES